jgi:hypothetical protein
MHFRGSLHIMQFAVYTLGGLQKRGCSLAPSRIHGHLRLHKRNVDPEAIKRFYRE